MAPLETYSPPDKSKKYKGPIPPRKCSNCDSDLDFKGLYDFKTNDSSITDVALLGPWAQIGGQLSLMVYSCPSCQKVEFYEKPAK